MSGTHVPSSLGLVGSLGLANGLGAAAPVAAVPGLQTSLLPTSLFVTAGAASPLQAAALLQQQQQALQQQSILQQQQIAAITSTDGSEKSHTIYVGNLNPLITADKLNQFFTASCGKVVHVRLSGERDLTSPIQMGIALPTFAFVQFETQEAANTAVTLTGMMLGDRPIKVTLAKVPIDKSLIPVTDVNALEKARSIQAAIAAKIAARASGAATAGEGSEVRRRKQGSVEQVVWDFMF